MSLYCSALLATHMQLNIVPSGRILTLAKIVYADILIHRLQADEDLIGKVILHDLTFLRKEDKDIKSSEGELDVKLSMLTRIPVANGYLPKQKALGFFCIFLSVVMVHFFLN